METIKKHLRSPWAILIAMIAGGLLGMVLPQIGKEIAFVGDAFIKLMRMGIAPLILCNVIAAIVSIGDAKRFARLGGKVVIIFMLTTLIAVIQGGLVGTLIKPGESFIYTSVPDSFDTSGSLPTLADFVLRSLPTNIITAMNEQNFLHIVVFGVIAGIALLYLEPNLQEKLKSGFSSISQWFTYMLTGIVTLAPIGVFALTANTTALYGSDIFGTLAKLIATVFVSGFVQILVVYPIFYFFLTKKNPYKLLYQLIPVFLTAFTTRSSAATIPMSLKTCKETVGVPADVADFVIPLGAVINADGSGIWYGIVAVFVAQSIGAEMTFLTFMQIALIGTAITMGVTGVPNAMFVMVPVFLTTIGFPLDFMGVMGVYPICETMLTALNVMGDNNTAAIVGEDEKKYQTKIAKAISTKV